MPATGCLSRGLAPDGKFVACKSLFMTLNPKDKSGFLSRHRWLVIVLGAVLAVILLASFVSMRGEIIPIRTTNVGSGAICSVISTKRKIEPGQHFEEHAPTNTTVRRLLVEEEGQLNKGQPL